MMAVFWIHPKRIRNICYLFKRALNKQFTVTKKLSRWHRVSFIQSLTEHKRAIETLIKWQSKSRRIKILKANPRFSHILVELCKRGRLYIPPQPVIAKVNGCRIVPAPPSQW